MAGWVLFSLPERADASDADLVWLGGEWRPSKQVRKRLAAPIPQLSVEWDPPETVTAGTEFTIDFSVTNNGALPSRFVAGLNRLGGALSYNPTGLFSRVIPPNETVSWTHPKTIDMPNRSPDGGSNGEIHYEYELVWSDETKSHSFTLVEAETGQ